jgi:thioredoxin-related protein
MIYLLFFIAILVTFASANDSFILDSIEETKRLSKLTNKPALIIFGADYCKFCNSLKEDILNNELSPIVDNYIICYIDIKSSPELKIEYNISMIPDSRILLNNQELSSKKGYSKESYKLWLENK